MKLETVCRECGRQYELDRAMIVAGGWQRCPECRKAQVRERLPQSWDTDEPERASDDDES